MVLNRLCKIVFGLLWGLRLGVSSVQGQQEIGFLEQFALAEDRRQALVELIPGTEDYFYFHCLHYQNEGQYTEAESTLNQWRAKLGNTPVVRGMWSRQILLTYEENPQRALDYLRTNLNLNLDHSPPSRDRAASLPTELEASSLETQRLLEAAVARDRSLGQIENRGLPLLLDRPLAPEALRALLGRLQRTDLPHIVRRIAEELGLKDSRGFGWARVHSMLTWKQLDELLALRPELLENDAFVRAYTTQLAPPEGTSLLDKKELRKYLQRMVTWARRLPPSQNSFKALVLGNLLRLDLTENKFDRERFLEYLALPRSATYYDLKRFRNRRPPMAELDYAMKPQVPLPAMGDDSQLVRRFLEHFLRSEGDVDAFASFLQRDFLEKVFAETRILYGIGDAATWYAKLTPAEQRELRERVEIRFAPHNANLFQPNQDVSLEVELKNIGELVVKIYEINTAAYLRNHSEPLGTDIDLDGLVANVQYRLEYAQPGQIRHAETLSFPQLEGRGVWIIDLLGGGQRSRALIRKGELVAVERFGDAGQVFQIFEETGAPVETAHIEVAGRKYEPRDGSITLPYAEKTVARKMLIVDGDFATRTTITHAHEQYALQAGFLLDRQSLVAGTQAAVAINTRLTCNDHPISIALLEESQLTITATDSEGIATTQILTGLDLDDGDEHVHTFLVPQRLRQLSFQLTGKVYNQSRDERQSVSADYSMECNGIQASKQIGDFYLSGQPEGYRLRVLGRNGEPIARMPVHISVKSKYFKPRNEFALATDADGMVALDLPETVESFSASAQGIQQTVFELDQLHRHWPALLQVAAGEAIELPLGRDTSSRNLFSLIELRRGNSHADLSDKLTLANGSITVATLPPGDYRLTDHEAGHVIRIVVAEGQQHGQFVVGKQRILQTGRQVPLIVRDVRVEEDELQIRVDGADAMTRVHVLADVFFPEASLGRRIQLPAPPLTGQQRSAAQSFYVDSLRLDEEYGYILDRQGMKRYPGNMLPQPSLLVHPWEVSVTENQNQIAAKGDAMPTSPPSEPADSLRRKSAEGRAAGATPDWKSFDFLASGAAVALNLGLENGQVRIPLKEFSGYSSLTVIAVHPLASDSRHITRDDQDYPIRDQRLRSAFEAGTHLAQAQRVEFLAAGERKVLGDPRTRRLQTYGTLADVFQLYSTLLEGQSEWEQFRFVTRWAELTEDEKRSHYNNMACHELNFFLYHKDRKFFDAVVRPFLLQKMDKQLVDFWLLGESLEPFADLWRVQRLNTLERVLLAQRVQAQQAGTQRWLQDYLAAHPIAPQERQKLFEIALRGADLGSLPPSEEFAYSFRHLSPNRESLSTGGMAGGGYGAAEDAFGVLPEDARGLRRRTRALQMEGEAAGVDTLSDGIAPNFFHVERYAELQADMGLFQSLDKTREWAESQYYQVRLAAQTPELIQPNPFWQQYLEEGGRPFLPSALDLPAGSVNEALCALAVIDLPFEAEPSKLVVENEELVVRSETPAILFLESIEESTESDGGGAILVGQDIYLATPSTADERNRPVQTQPLLRGVPYRASVVVTNPTSQQRRVQVLTQLPAGSLPLAGSQSTRSTPMELAAYSTAKVDYTFYFPAEGEYEHYGAQISEQTQHITGTDSASLRVLAEPESVDEQTWSYVADWGTNEQVLEFLAKVNLEQVDLARIAFRMVDKSFYGAVLHELAAAGHFEPNLWAFAVHHNDRSGIEQLLQNRPDFNVQLGIAFDSPLIQMRPDEQLSYEHLDYKPLVVARSHQLGPKRKILNASMHHQYHRLLDVLAHQNELSDDQRLQVCYYMLLQRRIDEALAWYDQVSSESIGSRMQYDFLAAYLDFYRRDYEHAAQIAAQYRDYPVPRWNELFATVRSHVEQRQALLSGQEVTSLVSLDRDLERSQRILMNERETQQTEKARKTPTLHLESEGGELRVHYQNVERIQVNYYLMDIELLFSRKPFVSQGNETRPVIQPNLSEELQVGNRQGTRKLELPEGLRNKNLLVEVTTEGISRSTVLTANSLKVTVVEPYGQLQVMSGQGRGPVEGAYVKVYAKHNDGSVRFFKDGYTDLRGQFDYATLSTGDLDTTQKLAILVLHDELGANVQETKSPAR